MSEKVNVNLLHPKIMIPPRKGNNFISTSPPRSFTLERGRANRGFLTSNQVIGV